RRAEIYARGRARGRPQNGHCDRPPRTLESVQVVAFLGGVNVGGHRVTMARLREEVVALGYRDARTFLASGNVIVEVPGRRSTRALEQELEGQLTSALGFPVPTYVRRASGLPEIAAREPFGTVPSGSTLQVVFLHGAPTAAQARAVEALTTGLDRFS